MVNISNPPLVVQTNKTVNLGVGGKGQADTFSVDMSKQSLADIHHMLRGITFNEIEQQERLNNPATRLVVDNREGNQLRYAKRKTETQFGSALDKLMIRSIEHSLMAEIRKATSKSRGSWNRDNRNAMGVISNWEWIFVEDRNSQGKKVNPLKLKSLPPGARLILRPKIKNVQYENMLAVWRDIGYRRPGNIQGKGNKGVTSGQRKGQGFLAKSINALKRKQFFKNYTVYVIF